MIKHPTPWRLDEFNFILDARGREVMHMPTDDPETRAILLHAAEMWEALKDHRQNGYKASYAMDVLTDKINAEIAVKQP